MQPDSIFRPLPLVPAVKRVVRAGRAAITGAVLATVVLSSAASAQGALGLHPHTSVTTRITAAVRPILTLSRVEIVSVEQLTTGSAVEAHALVRANIPYRIAVRAATVLGDRNQRVDVRDITGAWVPLSENAPVVVAEGAGGVNTYSVACRVVAVGAGAEAAGDASACSLAYELAPRSDATVLAAVAVVPVASTAASLATRQ